METVLTHLMNWHQIGLNLNSRGFDRAEIKILEGLVQKKVETLLNDVS